MPRLNGRPAGCAFNPRCPHATDRCRTESPPVASTAHGNQVACWLATPQMERA
jgi:oligopeptide/dipeptide ABC transporter ATP-binding protein